MERVSVNFFSELVNKFEEASKKCIIKLHKEARKKFKEYQLLDSTGGSD